LIRHALSGRISQHHASCLIKGGKIISISCNLVSIHAEEQVLRRLAKPTRGRTRLYSVRVTILEGVPIFQYSKPCRDCIIQLKRYGVKLVTYSTSDGRLITEKVSEIFSDHISVGRTP
jgi:deoxycytidylate deaminase